VGSFVRRSRGTAGARDGKNRSVGQTRRIAVIGVRDLARAIARLTRSSERRRIEGGRARLLAQQEVLWSAGLALVDG